MKSEKETIELLNGILEEKLILTDLEDRYVYSFEKIFLDQWLLADIVVRTTSIEKIEDIMELARKEEAVVIKRSEHNSQPTEDTAKTVILLDDVMVPGLEITPRKVSSRENISKESVKQLRTLSGSFISRALAAETLFFDRNLNKCHQCTTCGGYCTVAPFFDGIETWSSKGRTLLIRGIMNGDLPVSKKIIDVIYSCSKCGLCFADCFGQELDFHKAIASIRNQLVRKGMIPQVFQEVAGNILKHGDPSATPAKNRLSWTSSYPVSNLPAKADVLYWVGCTVANRNPKTAKALYNILNRGEISFTMLMEDEGCCGYDLLASGLLDAAKTVANGVIEKIAGTRASVLVTPCAGCYYTFSKLYPETLGVSLPCEILHSSQFIERMIGDKKINFRVINEKMTYHDPCSLGRHGNVYDAPRNVLRAIPGLQLVEMPFNRNKSRCCGGGGGLWTFNHRVSMDSAHTRLEEDLLPIGVSCLTTACPLCQMNLRFASKKKSIPVKISDITEIVDSAMYIEND